MKMILVLIRVYMSAMSIVSPKYTARKAFRMFTKVRKKSIRPRELDFYKNAKRIDIDFSPENIIVYELGSATGKPLVMVHGWDSNSGSMAPIAYKLADNGYRVLAINLPAHAYAKMEHTNIHVAKETIKAFFRHFNFTQPVSCVTHSFGSAALSYGLSELDVEVDRLVFLTAPNKIIDIFDEFRGVVGLNAKAYRYLCAMADDILGEPIQDLIVANKLKKVPYNHLLIIHDKMDKVLPFKNALDIQIQLPSTEIIAFENIGHYRMLWNEHVVDTVIESVAKIEVEPVIS